ncbi:MULTISPECIES: alanine/glycine:cation symporter family protein [Aneurinibacillus]|uniref:Sodium:alanine symporter family protein n=1 Tax=Aneurinibacillus thermoaerophilus TaxID=143495 RepID=A0ABX8YAJ3_ANETH|nr:MULTISPECIES: sodium:alanine symporter family protein [Aneurinibacillus]AMA71528.1 transporter [Aneurinibacillus sp. XH2]MED0675286.1 sodium:alanine symporter family protein [Aneurinibacillus thermoaerophilus]MED0678578.1 sodium:alanine symporter family protein [Aneurinibacillus thermoaerophilus]MED0738333.1 sodium:alanine symporter family protein [Aneurinibacillus thermoaerophilus]MED0765386.1 sodium:alanine symporter family protein [Aneurinibacillus thermoaerophilus]
MDALAKLLDKINGYVWGMPTLILLAGTGLLLTVRLRGLQFTKLGYALSLAFGRKQDKTSEGDINHFQALMTALAATIGIGNIAGVATAITTGGPGAIFWMWLTALFGMATKYSEAILAVKYRVKGKNGEYSGGPMYYLEHGLGKKWLAVLFSLFGICASFGIGNMVQANSVAEAVKINFSVPPVITGIALAVLTAFVILGGVQKIGQVTGVLVPFMAIFYITAGVVIILVHIEHVPDAIAAILSGAFNGTAAAGGFLGATVAQAIQMGVARGVFSNEAGLGSAPIAAAAAKTDSPAKQALVSMTGTFIDTIIVCSITGLALVTTGVWEMGKTGVEATTLAFRSVFGSTGSVILAVSIILFAYSTILGWAYYGTKCIEYLLGRKAVCYYQAIFIIVIAFGSALKLHIVWTFSDIANGLMAIPNLIGLIGLSAVVVAETRRFLASEAKPRKENTNQAL